MWEVLRVGLEVAHITSTHTQLPYPPLARTQLHHIAKMQLSSWLRNYLPGCTTYVATTPDHEGETDFGD